MRKLLAVAAMLTIGVALPVAAPAQQIDAFRAGFEVQVQSSFGTVFTDCFQFDRTNTLNILGFPTPLTYTFGDLDTDRSRFKAVTRSDPAPPFQIMFFGRSLNFGRIKGEALNEFGDTFIFSGVRNDSCPDALVGGAGRRWRSPEK